MSKFTHLHLHTVYSLMDGLGTSQDYAKLAQQYNHPAMAITDHGRMGGLFIHKKECLKNDIKPIFGIEMYVTNKLVSYGEKEKRLRTKNNHLVLLAKNEIGYKNLLRLNYLSNKDTEHYYYSPRITFDELFDNHEGIVCGSACLASPFSNLLKREKEDEAEELFIKFTDVFREDFYAEVQLNEVNRDEGGLLSRGQISYNNWLIEKATRFGVPIVIGGDVHYPNKEDYLTQELSFKLRSDKEDDEFFSCKSLYYHDIPDFLDFNKKFGYNYGESEVISWAENSVEIANRIDFMLPKRDRMFLPPMAINEEKTLINLVQEGLIKHFNVEKYSDVPEEYKERIAKELKLIKQKGISRYFLLLHDICQYADRNKIFRGPGRGSAAGSLVVASLDITKWSVDPLKYNLLFERFISEQRLTDQVIDYFVKE